MRPLLHAIMLALLVAAAGCDEKYPPTPAPNTPVPVTGRERFAWTQPAENVTDAANYRYAIYVDGTRRVLAGESCVAATRVRGLECTAPLPPLSAGRHTLELAAFVRTGSRVVESPRSTVLQVTVGGVTTSGNQLSVEAGEVRSSDGLKLRADVLARDLDPAVDLAAAPDGRVFVADARGAFRVFGPEEPRGSLARDENLLRALGEPDSGAGASRLLSMAVPPDFAQSRLLYAAYTSSDRDGALLRVARFREAAGVPGEAAVIASQRLPDGEVSAVIRIGPDGHLYVASGPADPGAGNRGAAAGQILRLRADGRTPEDNPSGSPVWSIGHGDPRGLVWLGPGGAMWEIEASAAAEELNAIARGANYGWGAGVARAAPGTTGPALTFAEGTDVSGLAAIAAAPHLLSGEIIVASRGARDLLRVRLDPSGRPRFAGRLLQGRFGRIGRVAAAADGSLYFVTHNEEEWGPAREALVRLRPDF